FSLNWFTKAPTCHLSTSASESPIPEFRINGSPHARYSPFLVGDDAIFEKHGLMKERPASAADKYEGTSAGETARTLKLEFPIFRSFINACTRSNRPVVSHNKCASGRRCKTAAKKSPISSVRYQPSSEPL